MKYVMKYKGGADMQRRTIDASTTRKLSVQAECDPRTLRKVLEKGAAVTKTMSAKRALNALVAAGLLSDDQQTA